MPRLLAHIGAPKTATTTLQAAFYSLRHRMAEQGVQYVPTKRLRGSGFSKALEQAATGGKSSLSIPDARSDTILLSEEGMTHVLMPRGRSNPWDNAHEVIASMLEAIDADIGRITITVRRQDAFIKSAYLHQTISGLLSCSFKEYCSTFDFSSLSWLRLVQNLESEVGRGKVAVVPFDLITSGVADYALAVLASLGINLSTVNRQRLDSLLLNESKSAAAIEVAKVVNRSLVAMGMGVREARRLNAEIAPFLPSERYGKASVNAPEFDSQMAYLFEQENAEFSASYLKEYPGALSFSK